MTYNDFRGVEIKVGDSIVYPVRRGSDLHLKSGKVLELTEATQKDYCGEPTPALKIKTLAKNNDPTKPREPKYVEAEFTSLHRCVVVDTPSLKVYPYSL